MGELAEVASEGGRDVVVHADLRHVVHIDAAGLELVAQIRVFERDFQARIERHLREDLTAGDHHPAESPTEQATVGR